LVAHSNRSGAWATSRAIQRLIRFYGPHEPSDMIDHQRTGQAKQLFLSVDELMTVQLQLNVPTKRSNPLRNRF